MPTLRCEDVVAFSVPVKTRFSKPGPAEMTPWFPTGVPLTRLRETRSFSCKLAMPHAFASRSLISSIEGSRVHWLSARPRRSTASSKSQLAIAHRAGDAKASDVRMPPCDPRTSRQFHRVRDVPGWETRLPRRAMRWPFCDLKIRESSIGAANIAGENHFSKFLQRRPSRSSSSSASFGPQVPAA